MRKQKHLFFGLGALAALAIVLLFNGNERGVAAPGAKGPSPVEVVNTSPIPVSPTNVEPIVVELVFGTATDRVVVDSLPYTVPADKRLVVETISVVSVLTHPTTAVGHSDYLIIHSQVGDKTVPIVLNRPRNLLWSSTGTTTFSYEGTQSVRFYADPGTEVWGSMQAPGSPAVLVNATFSLVGHLVDVVAP